MAKLTQAQVLEYNKKVVEAQKKAAENRAKKELAEKELMRTCRELTNMLGKEITPENLAEEYEVFVQEAEKTIVSGEKILASLEQDSAESAAEIEEDVVLGNKADLKSELKVDAGMGELDDMFGLN